MRFFYKFCALFLFSSLSIFAQEGVHDIKMEVNIKCPMSQELIDFQQSIPSNRDRSVTYQEFKDSFLNNLYELINLIESENIYDCVWSVGISDANDTI